MASVRRLLAGLPAWFIALYLAALIGGFCAVYAWQRTAELNRRIADPAHIAPAEHTPDRLVFAKARQLDHDGDVPEAIRLYTALLKTDDDALLPAVHYNLATVYLRDGARLWNARGVLEYARVNTLLELAKQHYRQALRLNPDDGDARYNLEYAYRITPPPKEKPKSDWKGSKSSVFSTLPGIPGGGP